MNIHEIKLSIFRGGVKLFSVHREHKIGKLYPVRVVYEFIISHLKSSKNVALVQGHKMFLDPGDQYALSVWGVWEALTTGQFKKEIKKGDVVLDVGAGIGYYTLIAANLVGETGRVYAFEPDPDFFGLLKKNIEINGYKNVILEQKAVSDKTGKNKSYLCKDEHRIHDSPDACHKFIEIESIRLDDYFKNYDGKINFIKMDIEGAEIKAIQGAPLLLQKNKNLKIITEFLPMGLIKFGIEPKEYINLLIDHGFKLYEINAQEKKIEPVEIAKLVETYTPEKVYSTNLLCIRD